MLKEYLSNIADQFRTHLDTTEPINAQDFAGKIEDVALKHNLSGFASGKEVGIEQGKLELLRDSEYMNAKVSGTAIAVNDVNSIEHNVGVQLKSKNLFNAFETTSAGGDNAFDTFEQSEGCVTVTSDNSNGSKSISFNLLNAYLQKGNYILSFDIECENSVTTSGNCDCMYVWHNDVFYTARSLKNDGQNGSIVYKFTLIETTKVIISWYKNTSSYTPNNTIYKAILSNIQLELGTTATEYTPYVANVGGIEVSRYGKNLFDKDNTTYGQNKYWYVDTGQLVLNYEYYGSPKMPITPNTRYTRTDTGTSANIYFDKDGNFISNDYNRTVINSPSNAYYIAFNIANAISPDEVQVELGTTATAYTPFIEPTTYQSTADGTVKGVTSISPNMTLLTNNNGVVINANYLRDIDTYIDNLKTNVALTGGE